MMTAPRDTDVAVKAEKRTHRHLNPSEPVRDGDVYGGDDWGFVFTIGSDETEIAAGTPAHLVGMQYRPRRPL